MGENNDPEAFLNTSACIARVAGWTHILAPCPTGVVLTVVDATDPEDIADHGKALLLFSH